MKHLHLLTVCLNDERKPIIACVFPHCDRHIPYDPSGLTDVKVFGTQVQELLNQSRKK